MQHQALARLEGRLKEATGRPWSGQACRRSLPRIRRHTLGPQRLQVSCPAVEQDTESPATSGRPHPDSGLIHALFQTEQPTLAEVQDGIAHELNRRIREAGSLPQLCDLVQQEAPSFTYVTASHALYRLSILCRAFFTQLQSAHLTSREAQQAAWVEFVEPALQLLGQLLIRHMDGCDAWAVSISFWAYGNLQCSDEPVLAALCERGMQVMHGFSAIDCASALVGIAKLRVRPRCLRELLEHLLSHTHDLLSAVDAWGCQEIANALWALSRIGAAGPSRRALLEGLLEMTLWRLHDFKMRELALVVYSCGRLRLRLPMQLVQVTAHIAANVDTLTPLDAAHVMWGCAKLDLKPGAELMQRLPHAMLPRLAEFKPQEVCNLLYGYGSLRYRHPALLEGVSKACAPRLHEFSTQDLCLTLWSYGALGYCPSDAGLFDAACRVLLSRSARLLPIELTMAVKGFARAGYQPPPEFMRQVAALAAAKLPQFSPTEYAQLLWAYAALGYRDVQLFEAVVGQAIFSLQSGGRRLPKTTVDTLVYSCERVGFWPQALVETAEVCGLYVKSGGAAAAAAGNGGEVELLNGAAAAAASASAPAGGDGGSEEGRLAAEALQQSVAALAGEHQWPQEQDQLPQFRQLWEQQHEHEHEQHAQHAQQQQQQQQQQPHVPLPAQPQAPQASLAQQPYVVQQQQQDGQGQRRLRQERHQQQQHQQQQQRPRKVHMNLLKPPPRMLQQQLEPGHVQHPAPAAQMAPFGVAAAGAGAGGGLLGGAAPVTGHAPQLLNRLHVQP